MGGASDRASRVSLLGAVGCLVAALPFATALVKSPVPGPFAVTGSGLLLSRGFLLACIAYNQGRERVRWTAGAVWSLALLAGSCWAAYLARIAGS